MFEFATEAYALASQSTLSGGAALAMMLAPFLLAAGIALGWRLGEILAEVVDFRFELRVEVDWQALAWTFVDIGHVRLAAAYFGRSDFRPAVAHLVAATRAVRFSPAAEIVRRLRFDAGHFRLVKKHAQCRNLWKSAKHLAASLPLIRYDELPRLAPRRALTRILIW